jgi:hypothetical protein
MINELPQQNPGKKRICLLCISTRFAEAPSKCGLTSAMPAFLLGLAQV